jgi:hypothetical protein
MDQWTSMSPSGAPTGRQLHSAAWTGAEMVIWGGFDGAGTQSGGRYDPSGDIWDSTSLVGAPPARYNHAAAWTGTELMVWGGFNGGYLDTGGRYDPAADQWVSTAVAGAPTPRWLTEMAWTGTEMLVWGGQDGTSVLDIGARYDPVGDTWTSMTMLGAPSARTYHSAVWTGSFLVIWGGEEESAPVSSGGRYVLGHADDGYGDGFSECDGDCDDSHPEVWGMVDPVSGLMATSNTSFAWSEPASTGTLSSIAYDVLRTSTPGDLSTATSCLESADGGDTAVTDPELPLPGEGFFYVVRPQNGCPGLGPAGANSSGVPREARACP